MGKRKFGNFYSIEKRVYENHTSFYKRSDDGTLFANAIYRTKIYAEDLPEWFIYGRYYKLWGYLSSKGITNLLYVANKSTNHYLKDDCLMISYGGKITLAEKEKYYYSLDRYEGYDERVWGNEILDILRGAKKYSGYDISGIIEQLREKKNWIAQEYPDEFGEGKWSFDIVEFFSRDALYHLGASKNT